MVYQTLVATVNNILIIMKVISNHILEIPVIDSHYFLNNINNHHVLLASPLCFATDQEGEHVILMSNEMG